MGLFVESIMRESPVLDMEEEVSRKIKPEMTEKELVKLAQSGDLDAYDALALRYRERVYSAVYGMTFNHEDANDLTQEAFIKAYRSLKSFKGVSSFYTWIYRIAINRTINFIKQKKNKRHLSLNDLDSNVENDPELVQFISDDTPHRDAKISELKEKLNEALMQLSDTHRMVVILHDVQGYSHDQISEIMDCNTGTVRSRLFYARQQLQALLSDYLKD